MPITKSAATAQKIRWLTIVIVVVLSLSIAVTIPGLDASTDGTVSAQQINETQSNTTGNETNASAPVATDENSQANNSEGGLPPLFYDLISINTVLAIVSIVGVIGTLVYGNKYSKQKNNIEKSLINLNERSGNSLSTDDESAEKLLKEIEKGNIILNDTDGESANGDNVSMGNNQNKTQYIETKDGGDKDEQAEYKRKINETIHAIDEMLEENPDTAVGIALSKLVREANQDGSDIEISEIKTQFKKALDKEKEYSHLCDDLESYNLDGTIPDDPQWEQLRSELDDDRSGNLTGYIRKLARSLNEYQRELKNAEETKQMYRKKANHYDAISNGLNSEWIDENVQNHNNKDDIVVAINSGDIGVRKISKAANDINRSDPPGTDFLTILQSPTQFDPEEITSAVSAVMDDLDEFRAIEAELKEIDRVSLEDQIDIISTLADKVESQEFKSAVKDYLSQTERAIDTIPENNHLEIYAYGKGLDNIQQLLDSIDTSAPQVKGLDSLRREYEQTKSDLKSRQNEKSHQITSIGDKIANHFIDMADAFTDRGDTEASNGNDEAAKSLYQGAIKLLAAVRELYDDKALRKHMRRL